MLVKFDLPASEDFPHGKQVWIEAESIDRLEGDINWRTKQTTIYLKQNPTVPFAVINKSLPDVAEDINRALDPGRRIAVELQRIAEALEQWQAQGE